MNTLVTKILNTINLNPILLSMEVQGPIPKGWWRLCGFLSSLPSGLLTLLVLALCCATSVQM